MEASSSTAETMSKTPPTPSGQHRSALFHAAAACSSRSASKRPLSRGGLLMPVQGINCSSSPAGFCLSMTPLPSAMSVGGPALYTPVEYEEHHTPPADLRRASLVVPPSECMVRMAQGSGVSVYRMDRSPREGRPRSPWVLKKANVSPLLVRERRRVERTLEHESCMLATMDHPNIVGFRAAQRLPDGHLCIALEHCEVSLYALIQERARPQGGCVSPTRGSLAGELFQPHEVSRVGHEIAQGLAYLHNAHHLLHGDVKSANILLSRDLARVKICDLGVSIPLTQDNSSPLSAGALYDGTEPWRPPETLLFRLHDDHDFHHSTPHQDEGEPLPGGEGGTRLSLDADGRSGARERIRLHDIEGLHLCDRTDVFAFGLVLWEMLTGDVPHAAKLAAGDDAYRDALGTRPPLPQLPMSYDRLERTFRWCTQQQPDRRPCAAEVAGWLALEPNAAGGPPPDPY